MPLSGHTGHVAPVPGVAALGWKGGRTMAEEARTVRRQVRRVGSPRQVRHVVKVSAEQETRLLEAATEQGVTVPRLLVESALTGGAGRGVRAACDRR